jgi:alpha-tubulin suppressor-like RCC1 family protein
MPVHKTLEASKVLGLCALMMGSGSGCIAPATELTLRFDTNIAASRQPTLRVFAFDGSLGAAEALRRSATAQPLFLDSELGRRWAPGSVTISPREGGPRDGFVTLWMVVTANADGLQPAMRLTRMARARFVRGTSQQARIFFNARCVDSAVGCTSVPAERCTVSERCVEQGATCGDQGECVDVELPTSVGRDAEPPDVEPRADASAQRVDAQTIDSVALDADAGPEAGFDARDARPEAGVDGGQDAADAFDAALGDADASQDASSTDVVSGDADAGPRDVVADVAFEGPAAPPSRFALGRAHSCVLSAIDPVLGFDGPTVTRCWGENTRGQLGDGLASFPSRGVPGNVFVAESFVSIHAGLGTSCGRTRAGALWCWGENDVGQIGDGTTTQRTCPVPVSGLRTTVSASVGEGHVCAVDTTGTVWCWGLNNFGQLGDGTTTNRRAPTAVPGITDAIEVAAGAGVTCARTRSGRASCWGNAAFGTIPGMTGAVMAPARVTSFDDVVRVQLRQRHACVTRASGEHWCWGDNSSRAPAPSSMAAIAPPTPLAIGPSASTIAVGHDMSCAIVAGGAVHCWGANVRGQLGRGVTGAIGAPAPGLSDVVELGTGLAKVCARTASGSVLCWGTDVAPLPVRDSAVPIPMLSSVTQVSTGDAWACARREDGTVWCWGIGGGLVLGARESASFTPVRIMPFVDALDVSLGLDYGCVRTLSAVSCWGNGASGQLGNGVAMPSATPVAVRFAPGVIDDVIELKTGGAHACVRRRSGPVLCWGANTLGQLGDGTRTNRAAPVAVRGLPADVEELALGGTHSCARTRGGNVWCWGSNDYGEIGDGTLGTPTATPVVVLADSSGTPFADARAISASRRGSCALVSMGRVRCWGHNRYRHIDTSRINRVYPSPLSVVEDAVEISGGGYWNEHCVRRAGGRVACIGSEDVGFVTEVPGFVDARAISSGGRSYCALRSDGTVVCWGSGQYGELGFDPGWSPLAITGL